MRPAGNVAQALLTAARELTTPERAPTLAEMTDRACVGRQAARHTVANLHRAGVLHIVRERVVDYRNRPVAEYAPAAELDDDDRCGGHTELVACMSSWGG